MKTIAYVALFCLIQIFADVSGRVITLESPFDDEWNEYKIKFKKTYVDDREEVHRRSIWIKNFLYLRVFNQHIKQSYTIDLNEFSDRLTSVCAQPIYQFRNILSFNIYFHKELVSGKIHIPKGNEQVLTKSGEKVNMPDTFDWRTQGVVGPVKDQGAMGSVFAFVTQGIT